jgi:hypothetical protein
MTSIDAIILAKGGYDHLANHPIRVECGGFMPLSIECVGTGPRYGRLIAVHHTFEQNGDLMFDPEVVFEVVGDEWHPVTFEQSGMAYWEAVFVQNGKVMVRPRLLKDLQKFCRMWNKNIRDQGFIKAAQKPAAA